MSVDATPGTEEPTGTPMPVCQVTGFGLSKLPLPNGGSIKALTLSLDIIIPLDAEASKQLGAKLMQGEVQIATKLPPGL